MTVPNVSLGQTIEPDWGNAVADQINDNESEITTIKANSWVTTARLAADAVTGAKIAADTIDSEHYAAGSIDAEHLASNSVTTAKIAADAVNGSKIANDSINSEHYVNGSIDAVHLASNSVTNAKLANSAVDTAELAANAVVLGKLSHSKGVSRRTGGQATIASGAGSTVLSTGGTGISSGSLVIVNVTIDIVCVTPGTGAVVARLYDGLGYETSQIIWVPKTAGERQTLSRMYVVTSTGNEIFQLVVNKTVNDGDYKVNDQHTSIDWVAIEAS